MLLNVVNSIDMDVRDVEHVHVTCCCDHTYLDATGRDQTHVASGMEKSMNATIDNGAH